jgi:hypothetical protein
MLGYYVPQEEVAEYPEQMEEEVGEKAVAGAQKYGGGIIWVAAKELPTMDEKVRTLPHEIGHWKGGHKAISYWSPAPLRTGMRQEREA